MNTWLYSFLLLIYGLAVLCLGSWVFADWFKRMGNFLSAYLWLLGITFFPFPMIIIYFLVRPNPSKTSPVAQKKCPYCNHELAADTQICPHCNHYLDEEIKLQK